MRRVLVVGWLAVGCANDPGSDGAPAPDAGPEGAAGLEGRCVAAAGQGEACVAPNADSCLEPLRCIDGTCVVEAIEDGACASSGDCADALYCARHTGDGQRDPRPVCRPRGGEGEACMRADGSCLYPLRCIDGTCRQRSAADGPCSTDTDCATSLFCQGGVSEGDRAMGRCAAEVGEGDPCDPDEDACGSRLRCLDGRCAPRGVDGEPCVRGADCATEFYCDRVDDDRRDRPRPICRREVALGGACDPKESGMCEVGDCVGGVCRDDQPAGAPCRFDTTCAEGLYCVR